MLNAMFWFPLMPASCLMVIRVHLLLVVWFLFFYSGLFFGRVINCFKDLNMFVSDTQFLSCVMHVLGVNHVCMNAYCVCCCFSGDRIERWLCGGRAGLWVPRRRRSGTSQPRQAIYLLHIWILLLHLALLYFCFLIMHGFSILLLFSR
jgi:hypothetical protein